MQRIIIGIGTLYGVTEMKQSHGLYSVRCWRIKKAGVIMLDKYKSLRTGCQGCKSWSQSKS